MATFKYTVEGIYETDKGSGKDYTSFNYDITLSRFREGGAGTHILRRFLPLLIKKDKKNPLLSKIKQWLITDCQKVDDKFRLEGKNINELSEYEIQELACMYDLYEVPLPSTTSITDLRAKASQIYLKKVLKVPMKTTEEKLQNEFFKKQDDGTIKFDNTLKIPVQVVDNFIGKVAVVKKKTLADYIQQAGQAVAEGVLAVTGNKTDDGQKDGDKNNGFPSSDDLTKNA